ncbi:MAG: lasso peptide biosynthesis B2 protein [Ilumatobacteraceae bacterium]
MTTLHVVAVIVLVEVLIRSVRLTQLSRLLGVPVDLRPSTAAGATLPLEALPPRAQRQLRSTWSVADAWPFSRGPCLRRALVGGHLIRDLDPTVHLGIRGAGDTIHAHAWLEVEGRPLETLDGFTRFGDGAGTATR